MRALRWLAPLGAALALAAAAEDPLARGRAVFADTQDLAYPSCAHCHAVVPPADEAKLPHVGPGATLFGAAMREGWRNVKSFADVGEASQACAKQWQKRKRGLEGDDLRAVAELLKSIGGTERLPLRKVEKTPKLAEDLTGGDEEKGKPLAERFCAGCHNDEDDALSARLRPHSKVADAIARKVRGYDEKGKFRPQEGSMSYYTTDRLTDEDLRHILAYLGK